MDLKKLFPLDVAEGTDELRLDRYLSTCFPDLSRAQWVKLLDQGAFSINGKAAKASTAVSHGQTIRIERELLQTDDTPLHERTSIAFRGPEPRIVFEDADILVIDKPAGLTVHPGAGAPLEETLVAWLLQKDLLQDARGSELLTWGAELVKEQRPGIVHRFDRPTSGLLVVARHPKAHAALSQQFSDREAGRLYWALTDGTSEELRKKATLRCQGFLDRHPQSLALRMDDDGGISFAALLDRDPKDRVRFCVQGKTGRRSLTHLRPRGQNEKLMFLEAKLETGRTHQIRVHLSFLGSPIVGDDLYGGRASSRLWLHAHSLRLIHPMNGQELVFGAPWPEADRLWLEAQGFATTKAEFLPEASWAYWNSRFRKNGLED